MLKLTSILFENLDDTISIIGFHRNNNPDFTKEDITMEPRKTRQSKRGGSNVGFYITMPKMKIDSVEDLPTSIVAPVDVGEHYGEHLYAISISVPRNQIKLDNSFMGSTRIKSEDLPNFQSENIKFIYIPLGMPSAEGVVLDPSIITSIEKIEQQGFKP
jgi:hypothetical protein